MQPLEKSLRTRLEHTIKDARDIAEQAARASLEQLGVGDAAPFSHLSEQDRVLRRRLRVHGRQLGDVLGEKGEQKIDRLVEETAYEHWHRMLFARFLAENELLMYWPEGDDEPIDVDLETCQGLLDEGEEQAASVWELAARFAARMLPQIFRLESPIFQLTLPPEHQLKLERLVADLPMEVFTASDSLGWVYQFWQAKKKDEVNKSEVKIGARELPAVTQLFTEPYMVSFLLDNSLGAWWAARRLTDDDLKNAGSEEELRLKVAIPGVPLNYLRFTKVEAASSRFLHLSHADPTIGYFNKQDTIANLSGNLPHWRQESVTYFVTFRTSDSLPQVKLNQWKEEKAEWLEKHPEPHDEATKREFYERFPDRLQKWLDQGYGDCLLGRPELKTIVEGALHHFNGDRYELDKYVIVPNHVHVLVTPRNGHDLSEILHSWKSFTSTQINKKAGRKESFWQKESFDHIVRSAAQLEKIRLYIANHNQGKNDFQPQQSRSGFQPLSSEVGTESLEKKRLEAASTVWIPAAGTFDDWPEQLCELKTLDPCCGSGHFLVAAFLMLVPMRMERDGLSAQDAVDAVLRENIHGLELDKRCVELAAFALALTAWKYPGAGGFRPLPDLNVACSGLSISAKREDWLELAGEDVNLRIALDKLYDHFKDAPTLGSLIDPEAILGKGKLFALKWEEVGPLLTKALEDKKDDEKSEMGVVAQGLSKAANILADTYVWVITNVPYLARGKQSDRLKAFCEKHYPKAKNDLATVFLDRCLKLCMKEGTSSIVLPQNWLFLTSYKKFRERLLRTQTWHLIARLGAGAFETISGEVVKAILLTLSRGPQSRSGFQPLSPQAATNPQNPGKKPLEAASTLIRGLDVSEPRTAAEKAEGLVGGEIKSVEQGKQLENPDARVTFNDSTSNALLVHKADYGKGSTTGDGPRYLLTFWEFSSVTKRHTYWLNSPNGISPWSGRSYICKVPLNDTGLNSQLGCRLHGQKVFGRHGVVVNKMRKLEPFLYSGSAFDDNICPICPHDASIISALWAYVDSDKYNKAVREIDQKLNVTAGTLTKVPFDLPYWTKIAQEKYPNGLPKPYTDDPTQWIFHGHPCGSVIWDEATKWTATAPLRTDDTVLHIAVARLLGYRWPAELDADMELADEQREWVNRCEALLPFADDDGIVCIPPVRGEASATERLLDLLAAAYGDAWSNDILSQLLANANHAGKSLETWLREKFFTQHCKLFKHRPFIWQIWDGLNDGFSALVNYHKLDYKNLETLTYTYLGDWITRQNQDIEAHIDGAQERLAAAEALKKKLELILQGEAPHDIFVRWKPLEKQPIGWNPDLNDGVRLNIRPFMTVGDVKKKGAGILRDKPNIKWGKDRGKDVESAPWYRLGLEYDGKEGDRINEHHLSLAEKRTARLR
ncbi:MAG: transposase [Desulfoplanes sp.]